MMIEISGVEQDEENAAQISYPENGKNDDKSTWMKFSFTQ